MKRVRWPSPARRASLATLAWEPAKPAFGVASPAAASRRPRAQDGSAAATVAMTVQTPTQLILKGFLSASRFADRTPEAADLNEFRLSEACDPLGATPMAHLPNLPLNP